MLLEIPTLDVNATGKEGVTALSLACLQGDLDIVQMLLARYSQHLPGHLKSAKM